MESVKKYRNEAIFREKNRNERQPDNLSCIENKNKSKARLILGLSRIVDVKKHVMAKSTKSIKSPLLRAETALGVDRWRGRRDTKHGSDGTQLDLDVGPNEEDGAE